MEKLITDVASWQCISTLFATHTALFGQKIKSLSIPILLNSQIKLLVTFSVYDFQNFIKRSSLKAISKSGYKECFQKWKKCWQCYITVQWVYLKRDNFKLEYFFINKVLQHWSGYFFLSSLVHGHTFFLKHE